MKLKSLAVCAAASLGMVLAGPAAATVLLATYQGSVTSGFDHTGTFISPGTDLAGYAFTANITFDTALGSRMTNTFGQDVLLGGSDYGFISPVTDAALTINGHTVHFGSNTVGGVVASPVQGMYSVYAYNYVVGYGSQLAIEAHISPSVATVDTPFTAAVTSCQCDFVAAPDTARSVDEYFYLGELSATSLTVSVVDGVPEPSTWALMIFGFGLVGGSLRRRYALGYGPQDIPASVAR